MSNIWKHDNFACRRGWIFLFFLFLIAIIPASAQLPSDVKSVKVEELTDEQIIGYMKQAEKRGISEEEQQALLLQQGMPAEELEKLKGRVAIIKAKQREPSSSEPKRPAPQQPTPTSNQDPVQFPKTPGMVYGQHLFRDNNLQFYEKAADIQAPDNYILGTDDELTISVFGFSFFNEVVRVDSRGAVNPKGIGPIMVKGLEFKKAKELIRSKFSQFFDMSNNQITITVSYSRVISVNFVGEVVRPGTYKIPAINSAFNALIAVGGPSEIGTVRNIQVKRNGKLVKTLDIYDYLNNPNSSSNIYLENNDYILVPPARKVVSISGEVRRPMKYELEDNEDLEHLIDFAGGLTSKAYTRLIRIKRLSEDGTQKRLFDVSLDSLKAGKKRFAMKDGDEVMISFKSEELISYVEIDGAVNMEGQYELKEGERISDLVRKANGPRYGSLLERAYLIRLKEDLTRQYIPIDLTAILAKPGGPTDLVLQKGDIVRIASNRDFTDSMKVDAIGAFRKPGAITFHEYMTLGDLFFLAGGLRMEADVLHIEISRISFFTEDFKPGEASRVIIKVLQVGKDIKIPDDQLAFPLSPFDQVFARVVPDFEYQQNLTLAGEVKYPGVYAIQNKDEKLSDLIIRAGGLNRYAFPEGATLYRPELPGGYIVMNLEEAMDNKRSRYNYVIKANDVINIPRTIDFVAVRGNVEYLSVVDQEQVNAPFVRGRRAKYYIDEFANGFTETSWKRKTYVVDNNAKVNKTKNFLLFKVYPKVRKGSVIYVIEKPKKVKSTKPREPLDWNKAINDFTVKLTGLATLIILFQAIK